MAKKRVIDDEDDGTVSLGPGTNKVIALEDEDDAPLSGLVTKRPLSTSTKAKEQVKAKVKTKPKARPVSDSESDGGSDSEDNSDSDGQSDSGDSEGDNREREVGGTKKAKRTHGEDNGVLYTEYEMEKEVRPLKAQAGPVKWWLQPQRDSELKWDTLVHNGVLFPAPYEPHGVKMLYDGSEIELKPAQEEIATWYAQKIGTPHVEKKKFNDNFFGDFRAVLGRDHVIKEFEKCDFGPIRRHLDILKEQKLKKSAEERKMAKEKVC